MQKKLFYSKQFGFQKDHSTDHVIVHPVDQICESFVNDNYTNAKPEMCGVNTTNLAWFANYLNDRKQVIKLPECPDTVKKDIKCRALQGSILGLLLFLLYVNDMPNSSKVLLQVTFAEDTFEHSNINILFNTFNEKLIKIREWFSANKLSLSLRKTKFSLFHKSRKK